MDNLPDIGGNLEDIITQTLARRRKRMADVSPEWGMDLSPEQVGATASGEPITMDAPTVRRTPEARMVRTSVAADSAESSPLMAQLMAIKGPGEVMTPESVQAAKQAYAARGGEFARGTLPTVEAAKAGEDARQRDLMERLERQAQGAANTSKATSSDGPPDTEPLYRQAFLEQLRNVGRAARGEQTVRVASPELAARDELAKWLASKQEREAGAAKLAQQERLEQMRSLLGLAKEEAATGRTKMQTEADVKRAEIAAEAKAAPRAARPPGAPKPPKPGKEPEPLRGMPAGFEFDPDANKPPPTQTQAQDFEKLTFSQNKMKGLVDEMKALYEENKVYRFLPTEARARLGQLATELRIEAKNVAELGALSGPDYALMEKLVPDPTEFASLTTDIPAKLEGLKGWGENAVKSRMTSLGVKRAAGAAAPKADTRRIAKNAKTGERRYINPDGSLGEVVP